MRILSALLVVLFFLVGCRAMETLSPLPTEAISPLPTERPSAPEVTPIGEILANPARYEGREVIVEGYYRGWDIFGETGAAPPKTRSDIAIADPTGGIYIVPAEGFGKLQEMLPPPAEATNADVLLRLRGRVERTAEGQPYILVSEGEIVSRLPSDIVLRARRTGGIAGFDQELTVSRDGTGRLFDRRSRQRALFPVNPTDVQKAVEALRPFMEQGKVGKPVPDGFAYTITVQDGEKVQSVTFYEGQLSDEAARALQPIQEWFGRGQVQPPAGTPRPAFGPVEAARSALAGKLGIPALEITVISYEAVDWPDTSLGCPQPGMMYAQVITPGYRVVLEAKGQRYEAHTDLAGGRVIFCSAP